MVSRRPHKPWSLLRFVYTLIFLCPAALNGQSDLFGDVEQDLSLEAAAEACEVSRSSGTSHGWGKELLTPNVSSELAACQESAIEGERAKCQVLRGVKFLSENDTGRAELQLREALAFYREAGDPWGIWSVQALRGMTAFLDEDYSDSQLYADNGLRLLELHLEAVFIAPMSSRTRELLVVLDSYEEDEEIEEWLQNPFSGMLFRKALLHSMTASLRMLVGFNLLCQGHPQKADQQLALGREGLAQAELIVESMAQSWSWSVEGSREFCPPRVGSLPLSPESRAVAPQCNARVQSEDLPICQLLEGLESLRSDDLNSASDHFEGALEGFETSSDSPSKWLLHLMSAMITDTRGDPHLAETHFLKAIDYAEGIERQPESQTLRLLTAIMRSFDEEMSETHAELEETEPKLIARIYSTFASSMSHRFFARSLACRNQTSRAASHSGIALQKSRELQGVSEALNHYSDIYDLEVAHSSKSARLRAGKARLFLRAGLIDEALAAMDVAQATARSSSEPFLEARLLFELGLELFEMGLFEQAIGLLERRLTAVGDRRLDKTEDYEVDLAHTLLIWSYGKLNNKHEQQQHLEALERRVERTGNRDLFVSSKLFTTSEVLRKSNESRVLLELESQDHTEKEVTEYLEAFRQLAEDFEEDERAEMLEYLKLADLLIEYMNARERHEGKSVSDTHLFLDKMKRSNSLLIQIFAQVIEEAIDGRSKLFTQIIQDVSSYSHLSISQLQEAQLLMSSVVLRNAEQEHVDENAAETSKRAIGILETFLATIEDPDAVTGLIEDSGHHLYRMAVDILARSNPEEAFAYAEKGRAWALRRVLGPASPLGEGPSTDMPGEGTRWHPKEPVTLKHLQRTVLKQDAAIVSYFLGYRKPETSYLWIWVVDRDGIDLTSIPLTEKDIEELICSAQELHLQGNHDNAKRLAAERGASLLSTCTKSVGDPSTVLYRRLIDPVAPWLDRRQLILIPHGFLHHLPFAALRNPETGRYLVESFSLSLAPSATILEFLSQANKAEVSEALVLGDPANALEPLVGARKEAMAVSDLLGGHPLLGGKATEEEIYKHSGRLRLLHLAAHGQYLSEDPARSRLLLSAGPVEDGLLEMREVRDRLDLTGTDLVVLSACQTALGEVTRGEDIHGLTQAFLAAGSRTVVSTLWPIDDEASAQLMAAFYTAYLKGSISVADALREAQLELIGKYPEATYYWAAFIATGDPFATWSLPSFGSRP